MPTSFIQMISENIYRIEGFSEGGNRIVPRITLPKSELPEYFTRHNVEGELSLAEKAEQAYGDWIETRVVGKFPQVVFGQEEIPKHFTYGIDKKREILKEAEKIGQLSEKTDNADTLFAYGKDVARLIAELHNLNHLIQVDRNQYSEIDRITSDILDTIPTKEKKEALLMKPLLFRITTDYIPRLASFYSD